MPFTPPHGREQQPRAFAGDCATSLIAIFLGARMGNPTRKTHGRFHAVPKASEQPAAKTVVWKVSTSQTKRNLQNYEWGSFVPTAREHAL